MSMSGDQTLNKIWVVFGGVLNIFIQWRMILACVSRAILLVKLLGLSFRLKWANFRHGKGKHCKLGMQHLVKIRTFSCHME